MNIRLQLNKTNMQNNFFSDFLYLYFIILTCKVNYSQINVLKCKLTWYNI